MFKAREFLEQTHALENMREDFLERELEKMCLESGQESEYAEHITAAMKRSKPVPTIEVVETKDARLRDTQTTSPAVYKHKPQPYTILGANPNKSMALATRGFCEAEQETKLQRLNDLTTTLQCRQPSLILPHDQDGNAKMLNITTTGDNQYMHIVLPAEEINILN
jgi:hypothetical protein